MDGYHLAHSADPGDARIAAIWNRLRIDKESVTMLGLYDRIGTVDDFKEWILGGTDLYWFGSGMVEQPVGFVRFSSVNESDCGRQIQIYVDRSGVRQGSRAGSWAVQEASVKQRNAGIRYVEADVRVDNCRSLRLFRSLGWEETQSPEKALPSINSETPLTLAAPEERETEMRRFRIEFGKDLGHR